MNLQHVSVAYTPDSDDAFYYCGLEHGKVNRGRWRWTFHTDHIIELNREAERQTFDITAISSVAYPAVARHYRILSVGTSVGRDYGPVLVSKRPLSVADLRGRRVGVPGMPTTGGFLMRWIEPRAELVAMPFHTIADAVLSGHVDAGVMIHEELLFYPQLGLRKVLDLGAWWCRAHKLPLPVGLNVIHRRFDGATSDALCDAVRESLLWSLAHRQEALDWTQQFGRGAEGGCGDRFISMFANRDSLLLPGDVRRALSLLLGQVCQLGMASTVPPIEIVEGTSGLKELALREAAA